MTKQLYWWLWTWITILAFAVAAYFDLHYHLYQADITFISFGIIALYFLTTLHQGKLYFRTATVRHDLIEFIAGLMQQLGMLGTLIGFVYLLGSVATNGVDITSPSETKKLVLILATGMGTALSTTAVGLVCSMFLTVQGRILK